MSLKTEMKLSLQAEYENAELGDARRKQRLLKMVEGIEKSPDASMPKIFSTSAELEASYRFLRNDNVDHRAILAAHTTKTAERARECESIIVAHDTTEFNFGKNARRDLGHVAQGKSYGFFGHFSLALASESESLALGICALQTHRRDGKKAKKSGKASSDEERTEERTKDEKPSPGKDRKDDADEGARWLRGVEESEEALAGSKSIIHVMDREADDYALLSGMLKGGYRFVIRSSHNRCTIDEGVKLSDALQEAPVIEGTRTISLSKRDESPFPRKNKTYPPRKKRNAQLSVRTVPVVIKRPVSASEDLPKTLELTLVQVIEQSPPKGEEPVVWNLWTKETTEKPEQVWSVVDAYRSRWVIEEYFKALKTGCSYLKRQFESEAALLRTLVLFVPVAWWLLMLRTLNRLDPNLPATSMLSPVHLEVLRGALGKLKVELPATPTVRDLLMGIARLGGHIPRNGEPGWLVLLRGLEKLMLLSEGFQLARLLLTGADSS